MLHTFMWDVRLQLQLIGLNKIMGVSEGLRGLTHTYTHTHIMLTKETREIFSGSFVASPPYVSYIHSPKLHTLESFT